MEAGSGTTAKFLPPKTAGVLARQRLFTRLDAAFSASRPCWLLAPPGAGKTMLAASYAQACGRPCLWYQLDAADADPATFFHHLGRAAESVGRHRRPALPALTPEYAPATFVLRFAEALYASLPADALLVFDDHDALPAEAPTQALFARLVELAPPGVSWLVLGREAPPPVFARLRLHGRLDCPEPEALDFTDEEIAELTRRRGETPATPPTVARVRELTKGWAAGVRLLIEPSLDAVDADPNNFSGRRAVFDYFAAEVLSGMDEATRRLLLATAACPRFTGGMAAALSGDPTAAARIEHLAERHCFVQRRAGRPPVYQYHPLFGEFLRARAAAEGGGAATPARAAALFEAADWLEEAAALYEQAGEWPGLERVCRALAPGLLDAGRHQALARWIGALPATRLEESPWLLYWFGRASVASDPRLATGLFSRAFDRFAGVGDSDGQYLAWAAAVETITLYWDSFRPLDAWLTRFDDLRREVSPAAPEVVAAVAASALLAVTWRAPEHPYAAAWLAQCEALVGAETDVNRQLLLASSVLLHHLMTGSMDRAGALVERFSAAAFAGEARPLARLAWYCWLITYRWNRADLAGCLEVEQAGRQLAEHSGVHVLDSRIRPQLAYVYLNAGDWRAATPIVEETARTLDPGRQLDVAHYHLLAGWCALLRGDRVNARGHSQVQLRLCREIGGPFPLGMALALAALRDVEEGDFAAAATHLVEARALIEQSGFFYLAVGVELIAADLAEQSGDHAGALAALRAGFGRARQLGLVSWFPFHPKTVARQTATALRHGIETDYLRELARRRVLTPDPPPIDVAAWPWPLRIDVLGGFSLLIDDAPLRFDGKAQHKPLELLRAIAALGGRDVPATHLADVLWPETDGDLAYKSFEVTLARLRRLVGAEAIGLRDGRVSLNPHHCRVDAWAFEQAARRLENAADNELADALAGVFAVYRGDLLADEDAAWAVNPRRLLRRLFVRELDAACTRLCARKKCREVIDACARAIEAGGDTEVFGPRLLRCHRCRDEAAAGQPGRASVPPPPHASGERHRAVLTPNRFRRPPR